MVQSLPCPGSAALSRPMRVSVSFSAAVGKMRPVGVAGGEWPQFRGPNASGVATREAAPPVDFGPSQRMVWKRALPPGHSSPVVWGDRIFLTAFDGKKLELICVSRKTGEVLWRRAAAAEQ